MNTSNKTLLNNALNECDKQYRHTKDFQGAHFKFYKHLLNGGLIERIDPLNNVQEILSADTLIKRHKCICSISRYGYKNLKCINDYRKKITYVSPYGKVWTTTYFKDRKHFVKAMIKGELFNKEAVMDNGITILSIDPIKPDVETFTIYVWPDGLWVFKSEYNEYEHQFISDDYKVITLNADEFDSVEAIDTYVQGV